jgi:Mg2+/Co2+ transporter CorB
MIGAVLIGYNVLNILSSALATMFITQVVPGAWGVAIATGVMTLLVVVFVEVLPKTLAIARADDVARALSGPMLLAVWLLGPVIYAIQWVVRRTLGLFGVRLDMATDVLAAHEEIRGAVEYHHSEGLVESGDRRMLGGVLDLGELTVADVMVHRRQIAMLDVGDPPHQIVAEALASPYTRLPLFRGEPENVVGVLHAKDIARAVAAAGDVDTVDIAAIAMTPWFVPETTHLKDQLNNFLRRRSHFALVVDEYGALQGLVTLEDILEEIVGEFTTDPATMMHRDVHAEEDGCFVVNASATIRALNRSMRWSLPTEGPKTLNGLIVEFLETIPDIGTTLKIAGYTIEVLQTADNTIRTVRIRPPQPQAAEAPARP